MPTEIYTQVEIDGKSYSIKKFTANTGLKIARLVLAKAAPLIPLLDHSTGSERVYGAVGSVLNTLEDRDIDDLVDKCLRVCFLNLPAGPQPIIDETGHYGVEGVEYDMALTLRLCVEAIKWGASDFFGEKRSDLMSILNLVGSSPSR